MSDETKTAKAINVFTSANVFKVAAEYYSNNGMPGKAFNTYKKSAFLFERASKKFAKMADVQRAKEFRASILNVVSGFGFVFASYANVGSIWFFEKTGRYRTAAEMYMGRSEICLKYSAQCNEIIDCYKICISNVKPVVIK